MLANIPASGTAIIEKLNEEHHKTKFPIVYTSADSVFQIALDTDLIPLETLYDWCKIARRILDEGEYGLERNTLLLKIGDGVRDWNHLPYLNKLNT